jgi:anti-sigma factor RsiW
MKRQTDETALLTRYLLGELSEDEQLQVEEQFFTDDDSFQQLQALEDELRYDYARGNLNRRERELFEKRFMATPADRERVSLAKSVIEKTFEAAAGLERAPKRSIWQVFGAFFAQPSFAPIAAMLAISCATGLLMEEFRLRGRLDQVQTASQKAADSINRELAQERGRREQLEQQQSAAVQQKPRIPTILSFVLLPGMTRDVEGPKRLLIPADTDSVRLQLDIKNKDVQPSYRASLQNLDGMELWSQDVRSAGSAVAVTLPARLLKAGDYLVELKSDSNRPEEYRFTVRRH